MIGRLLERLAARIDRAEGAWTYRVRPYDMVADRRRWWWQDRAPCQFSQNGLLAVDQLAALHRRIDERGHVAVDVDSDDSGTVAR